MIWLSEEIIECGENLGRKLNVEESMIEEILTNNMKYSSPHKKTFQVLNAWRYVGHSSTYRKLARALI